MELIFPFDKGLDLVFGPLGTKTLVSGKATSWDSDARGIVKRLDHLVIVKVYIVVKFRKILLIVLRNSRLGWRPLFVQKPPSWFKLMSERLKSPATRRLLDKAELHSTTSSSKINPPECGMRISEIRKSKENKIVSGEEADPEDWGWMIALYESVLFLDYLKCGGSLINSEWVVTAAHCVDDNLFVSNYNVRLGFHDRKDPESYSVKRSVSKLIIHPLYNTQNLHNDIALLKLSEPVEFTDQILPICLPEQNFDFSEKISWATGWGRLSYDDSVSNKQMQFESKILTGESCEKRYSILDPPAFNSLVNICTGGNGKSVCRGDSGGPLVVKIENRWFLAGILSWGIRYKNNTGCLDGGVFAKASYYTEWIEENLGENSSSSS